MVLYPDIFNYLIFVPSELGGKDFNDYKNITRTLKLIATLNLVGLNNCGIIALVEVANFVF